MSDVNPDARQMILMMRRAAGELRELRKILDVVGPRAEAYELIKKILFLVPGPSQGAGEDFAWTLDQEAKKLEEKLERSRTAASGALGAPTKPSEGSR